MPESRALAPIVKSTQLQIAIRQLNTAIKLFFEDGDDVSIYSLSQNSLDIISKILKHKGVTTLWDTMDEHVQPYQAELIRKNAVDLRNIFKHGTRKKGNISDENEEVVFRNELNTMSILFPVMAIHEHFFTIFKANAELIIYNMWFWISYPKCLTAEAKILVDLPYNDSSLSKKEFYAQYFRLAKENNVDSFNK